LQWLPHVETLTDLSELARLEKVEIESMKSLRDISSIARAPALRFLGLSACNGLTPEASNACADIPRSSMSVSVSAG